MAVRSRYPGVYIEEIPSGVRAISEVSTSITAFVGRAMKGPVEEPMSVFSFGDFERSFGGLWAHGPMSFAIRDYFLNGGGHAIVNRVHKNASFALAGLPESSGPKSMELRALSVGQWGNAITIDVDHQTQDSTNPNTFNLKISHPVFGDEEYNDLTIKTGEPNSINSILESHSELLRVADLSDNRPVAGTYQLENGSDGSHIGDLELFAAPGIESNRKGIFALDKVHLFNLLCIPPYTGSTGEIEDSEKATDVTKSLIAQAIAYCKRKRAVFIIDPHSSWSSAGEAHADVLDPSEYPGTNSPNAALYYPRLLKENPLNNNLEEAFVPCGAVAGIIARTDTNRGVWKAPAGLDADITGIAGLSVQLDGRDSELLNPIAVNCLRSIPGKGHMIWGSRTTDGSDSSPSEWKYLSVRRTALFIEESLSRGLQWVVFEPNDETLWSQIRQSVGNFLNSLFRQGAFQGSSSREAYFIRCDSSTTTQSDINNGIVNVFVGFAAVKPAEFIIIRIQQKTAQTQP